jgi:hypothetical protein
MMMADVTEIPNMTTMMEIKTMIALLLFFQSVEQA